MVLKDVIENKYTAFEKAYIIYNNEKIEITDAILEYKKESQVVFNYTEVGSIGDVLEKKRKNRKYRSVSKYRSNNNISKEQYILYCDNKHGGYNWTCLV